MRGSLWVDSKNKTNFIAFKSLMYKAKFVREKEAQPTPNNNNLRIK